MINLFDNPSEMSILMKNMRIQKIEHNQDLVRRYLKNPQELKNDMYNDALENDMFYANMDAGDIYNDAPTVTKVEQLEELHAQLPGVVMVQFGGTVPWQAHGFVGNYAFYAKSRNGKLRLDISDILDITKTAEEIFEAGSYGTTVGDDNTLYSASCEIEEFTDTIPVDLLAQLFDNLEIADIPFFFDTLQADEQQYEEYDELDVNMSKIFGHVDIKRKVYSHVKNPDNPTKDVRVIRATSSEEAVNLLIDEKYNPYAPIDKKYANLVPINRDTRVFDDEMPDFAKIARKNVQ